MYNTTSLKDLAMNAANTPQNEYLHQSIETEIPTEAEMAAHSGSINNNTTYVGSTPVIISAPVKPSNNDPTKALMNTPIPSTVGLDEDTLKAYTPNIQLPNTGMYTAHNPAYDSMLQEIMPDMSPEERMNIAKPIMDNRPTIVKDLIINSGFTPDEANTAADNRIKKELTEAYENAKKPSEPETGSIMINKSEDPNNLGLTPEEHKKLEKVKRVRLVVVEDMDLANITIERPDEEHKADYIKSIEGSLSKYSVPMPMLGDFLTFRGAPMVQLVNAVNYEDSTIDEIISTKASLIYEKLISGNILQKYDTNGKSILSYNEFANKFAYQDIDMALYGILCASSMEENSTSLTCQACSHQWMQTYNLKSLLKLDDISDTFKERVDNILKFKGNDIGMRKLYESMRKVKRFKSPFTNNIYDVSYPTIARATDILKRINSEDGVMTYLSAIALYLSRVLVYNESKRSYVEINSDETALLLETMKSLSNEDINMLTLQIKDDIYYTPKFILHAKCPECGKVSDIPVNIESLIFLTARDSMVEIDN